MSEPVSLGIVGLGTIAQTQHLPNIAEIPDSFRVAAVADISPQLVSAVASRLPGSVLETDSWREVCADPDVDAVLLLTPGAHERMTEEALLAGKHVLAEKPLCFTVAGANRLDQLARDNGLVLQVGYMKLHEPSLGELRNALDEIGERRLIRHTTYHPETEAQLLHTPILSFADADMSAIAESARFEEARTVEALGTIPAHWGRLYRDVFQGSLIHTVSLVRGTIGSLPSIESAHLWPIDDAWQIGEEPPSISVLGMIGDTAVDFDWLWLPDYPEYREILEIHGTQGSIKLALPPPYLRQRAAELTVRSKDRVSYRGFGHRSAFAIEIEAFHNAITGSNILEDAAGVAADTAWLQDLVTKLAASAGVVTGGEAGARR